MESAVWPSALAQRGQPRRHDAHITEYWSPADSEADTVSRELIYVGNDGAVRIGVSEDGNHIANDWFVFDYFRLTYYGNTTASFKDWVKLSMPEFSEDYVSKSYIDTYNSSIESLSKSITNEATAKEALTNARNSQQLKTILADIRENIELWQDLNNEISTAWGYPCLSEQRQKQSALCLRRKS